MANCKITHVYTGIAGSHIKAQNSSGMLPIRDREVTQARHGPRSSRSPRAVNIPADQQVLHVLPQEFIIDGQEGVREPLGMSGVRWR
jgi:cell division protein FtsA